MGHVTRQPIGFQGGAFAKKPELRRIQVARGLCPPGGKVRECEQRARRSRLRSARSSILTTNDIQFQRWTTKQRLVIETGVAPLRCDVEQIGDCLCHAPKWMGAALARNKTKIQFQRWDDEATICD